MNAGQLHRLARVLREIAQVATANEGERPVAASTVAIVEDVTDHPQSPITEIAHRTGLAQSLVSRTVDRLQARGVLTVGAIPPMAGAPWSASIPGPGTRIFPAGPNARSRMRSFR